jgi:regulator of replication initiation timing
MDTRTESIAELSNKVKMLVEQNELLRRHNLFLLEENNTLSREFAQFRRTATNKEQTLSDKVEQQQRIEQLRIKQYNDLQTQLRALEQGIEELYKHR